MDAHKANRQNWWICLGLGAVILAVYGQLWKAGFICFDDSDYVVNNPIVNTGLTWANIVAAFTTAPSGNWHPLTWISHMVDVQIYGLHPGGAHFTNIGLHIANSILLFLLLQFLTQLKWPSAIVAALFALHPIHVESVAWISERKDVLSTFFWILTIWAYSIYAKDKSVGPVPPAGCYGLALVLFAAGLMSKSMVVTLPFVLLLLDYWPLQRKGTGIGRLLLEKLPFFGLSIGSCFVTYFVQRHWHAVMSLAVLPMSIRLENTPVCYLLYIAKILWPAHLAMSYPLVRWSIWSAAGATALLMLVTIWGILRTAKQPWILVGWFWFLGTLVPVIGIVQVGLQAMADRYSYIPSIGLLISLVWVIWHWTNGLAASLRAAAWGTIIAICSVLTFFQASYWLDSRALLVHAINSTEGNFLAYGMLGSMAEDEGNLDEAIFYLRKSVLSNPRFGDYREVLGKAYLLKGDPAAAYEELRRAVVLAPRRPEVHLLLAGAAYQVGRTADAIHQYEECLRLDSNSLEALGNLAWILSCSSNPALRNGREAMQLAAHGQELTAGQNPLITGILAAACAESGDFAQAVTWNERARQLALAQNKTGLAGLLAQRQRSYQAHQPWREPEKNPPREH